MIKIFIITGILSMSVIFLPATKESINHTYYKNPFDTPAQIIKGLYETESIKPNKKIKGIIVPHHLLASKNIATGIKMISPKTEHIILISPDHFNKCKNFVCIASGVFETYFGNIHTSSIAYNPLIDTNKDLFIKEHGIYTILPYIAYLNNNIKVTPLAVSVDKKWFSKREILVDIINKAITNDTVIVVSSDFSHYLSLDESNLKDQESIKLIKNNDPNKLLKLNNPDNTDCPICLYLVSKLSKIRNFDNILELLHTNSANILNVPQYKETTSHFVIIYTSK